MKYLVYIGGIVLCVVLLAKYLAAVPEYAAESHETVIFRFKCQGNLVLDQRFSWAKQNREFIFEGILYDISGIDYSLDEVVIQCHEDIRETKLFSNCKIQRNLKHLHLQPNAAGLYAILIPVFLKEMDLLFLVAGTDYYYYTNWLPAQFIRRSDPPPEELG